MENPAVNQHNVNVDDRKCYSCGKVFKKPVELIRHKARKTPCLIRDIKPEDIKNPLRCIYCNKIFSNQSNLKKHKTNCKIKNGGLDKLHDKVQYEERTRIMQEEHQVELRAMEAKMQFMMEKIEKLEADGLAAAKVSNTINNTVNNINNGTIVHIHVNNYTTPNVDHLLTFDRFNKILRNEFAGLPVGLVSEIYFDKNHQENMSLHLVNKSTGEMIAMSEGNWKTINIDEVARKIRVVGYEIARKGIEMHNKNIVGEVRGCFDAILGNVGNVKSLERDLGEIKGKILDNREKTGSSPAILAKLEATRAIGRVKKIGTVVVDTYPTIGDNIVE